MTTTCAHRHTGRRCFAEAVYIRDGITGCSHCDRYYGNNTPGAGERAHTEHGAALAAAYRAEAAYVEAHGDWRRANPQWS